MNNQKTIDTLKAWIRETTPTNAEVLIPVSGGSDSAFCYWLYNQVIPERTQGVFIGTNLRKKEWFEQTGAMRYSDLKIANEKNAEIERWAHFLTLCIQENRILVGSRNKTEETLGTFSHASKVCSLLPLAGLWKSEVMELGEFVGIPAEILASSSRADPACGRPKRMADIPFALVDTFLQAKLTNSKLPAARPEQLRYLTDIFTANAYKKHLPRKGPGKELAPNAEDH